MKSVIISALVVSLFSAHAYGEELLYGACKPMDAPNFMRCITVDEQIVYTDRQPTAMGEMKFKKRYRSRLRLRLARKLSQQRLAWYAHKPMPSVTAILAEVDACVKNKADVKELMDRWHDVSVASLLTGNNIKNREKEMDVLEFKIGVLVDELCNNPQ